MGILLKIVLLFLFLHFVDSQSLLSVQAEKEHLGEYFFGENATHESELTKLVIFIIGIYNYSGEQDCQKQFDEWMQGNGNLIFVFTFIIISEISNNGQI